jgi:hypothetical protein
MTLDDDDVIAWTFNGQRTTCTVRIARLMLGAANARQTFDHGSPRSLCFPPRYPPKV